MIELAVEILIFGTALWLGLYLIARDLKATHLRLAGLGLIAYALGIALDLLAVYSEGAAFATLLIKLRWVCLVLPALFWTGALIYLLSQEFPPRSRLIRLWQVALVPLSLVFYLSAINLDWLFSPAVLGVLASFVIVLLPLVAILAITWRTLQGAQAGKTTGVLLVSLLFFAISTFLVIFQFDWLPRFWILLLLGCDLFLLGIAIAVLDAFDQGENFLPDFLRSFDFAFFTALLFGGQVGLIMVLGTGTTLPMLVLLLTTVATAIAVQVFSNLFVGWLDKVALANFPQLRRTRAELREVANTLPRVNDTLDLESLDEAEFTRLTRKAISHFGDLPRLAANPLTRLPQIEARLPTATDRNDMLERAAELKAVLAESIERLKPRNKGDFGTSDEWRFYNALYFPYVVGLKPYSLRAQNDTPDPASQAALEWFRTSVPERTLYNWQTIATKLIAQDLKQAKQTVPF